MAKPIRKSPSGRLKVQSGRKRDTAPPKKVRAKTVAEFNAGTSSKVKRIHEEEPARIIVVMPVDLESKASNYMHTAKQAGNKMSRSWLMCVALEEYMTANPV